MASSSNSTLSRYRPAILTLVGATAAYTAWLIYTAATTPSPSSGLHRSNAVRRGNGRPNPPPVELSGPQRVIRLLARPSVPLGVVDLFGAAVTLDARNLPTPEEARQLALQSPNTMHPNAVERRIARFYDQVLRRLLAEANRPMNDGELDVVLWFASERVTNEGLRDAIRRRQQPAASDQDADVGADARAGGSGTVGPVALDGAGTALPNGNASGAEGPSATTDENAAAPSMASYSSSAELETFLATPAPVPLDGAESIARTEMEWRSDQDTEDGIVDTDEQTLQRTLYHIAEDRARNEGVIHRGITCNGCDAMPIHGIRWRCVNCPDFDLCSDCEATNSHTKTHIFYKIRVPAPNIRLPKQESVYPGRPHAMPVSIPQNLRKTLASQLCVEVEEIDALYEQFTCLAATEWEADPNGVGWALDRRCFNHAFIPKFASFESAPNLIYDRVFTYFDTDNNALIGVEEFIRGLKGLHSKDQNVKCRMAFNGFDVDGDGYISRRDVLRIFRAHYAMEKEATRNLLIEADEELSVRGALDTIHSSQPLGSAFTHTNIPSTNPDLSALRNKPAENGNFQQPIVDDNTDTLDRNTILRQTYQMRSPEFRTESGDEAVRERWAQREYYVDEEEGFTRPPGVEDDPVPNGLNSQVDGGTEETMASDHERPRGSRSSSRVRFQDDVDLETRSNASTSSRPIGERWGGYEIPEPEQDLGKEVLYQIAQQGFNELLDPLFKEKEDSAMDAFATRAERRTCVDQIERLLRDAEDVDARFNKVIDMIGEFEYANIVINHFCNADIMALLRDRKVTTRAGLIAAARSLFREMEAQAVPQANDKSTNSEHRPHALWNAKLCRVQMEEEVVHAVVELATRVGWLPSDEPPVRDPTLPQFRPNSLSDLEVTERAGNECPSSSDVKNDIQPRYITPKFGPFFVLTQEPSDIERFSLTRPPSSAVTSSPPVNPDEIVIISGPSYVRSASPASSYHSSTSSTDSDSRPPSPVPDRIPVFILYLDAQTRALTIHRSNTTALRDQRAQLRRRLRIEGRLNKDSPLHLPFLASMVHVDSEINERGGSGLLDFAEFEGHLKAGQMRFLESWMDWVSF